LFYKLYLHPTFLFTWTLWVKTLHCEIFSCYLKFSHLFSRTSGRASCSHWQVVHTDKLLLLLLWSLLLLHVFPEANMSETLPYPHCVMTYKFINPWTEFSNRSLCIYTDSEMVYTKVHVCIVYSV
jgi:hypothetical protein